MKTKLPSFADNASVELEGMFFVPREQELRYANEVHRRQLTR